ncbi:MAG: sulfatase-like hydrolase/transferase [Phycisphaeraceae bacterium]
MTHRTLRSLALPLFIIALLLAPPAFAQTSAKPNIILCMADDQGWGDTAYNGHPLLVTPHLDAMAKSGLRFDHFYAAHPVCTPTRASVMTGRTPNRMGAFKWGHSLRPQEITVAEALKSAGYVTGHFGKWHIGSVRSGSPVNPGASGFDHWLSAENFYDIDPILSREGKAVELKGESSMIAADAAIDFMKAQQKAGKPFLAVVWFGSPHVPHRAADEDLAHYKGDKNAQWLGEITGLDRAVGKLRASLRDMNIADNTLFWYCSDNGGLEPASSGGRAKKGSIYEGGLRVPAIIEWPAKIKSPRIINAPAVTSDIYPTLLEIVGVKIDKQPVLDGVSLLPIIEGKDAVSRKAIGFWDHPTTGIGTPSDKMMTELLEAQKNGDESAAPNHEKYLRKDAGEIKQQYPEDTFPGHAAWLQYPWKLHRIEAKNGKVTLELYNLKEDPMEAKDLAGSDGPGAAKVKMMQGELEAWLASVARSLNGKDY